MDYPVFSIKYQPSDTIARGPGARRKNSGAYVKYLSIFSDEATQPSDNLSVGIDNKKGGHGQQITASSLKQYYICFSQAVRRSLFHFFKVSINNIFVGFALTAACLASGLRTRARLWTGLILGGLGIHNFGKFMGCLGQ